MLRSFFEQVLRRPRITLVVVGLMTILFGFFITRVRFSSQVDEFFIKDDPEKLFFEEVKEVFGEDKVTVIAMVSPPGEDIFIRERLLKLRRVSRAIQDLPGVQKVLSLTNVERIWGSGRSINVEPLIEGIPETDEEWDRLRESISENPMYDRNLVSPDLRATAINVFMKESGEDQTGYYATMDEIYSILNKEALPEKFYVSGIAATDTETNRALIRDLKRFLPLTFVFIIIILAVSFRSMVGIILPLATVIIGTAWTIGFMGMMNIGISLVTVILPPLIITIASAYAIHVMSEYIEDLHEDATAFDVVSAALNKVALPTLICGFTTAIGFGSLGLNRIPNIRNMGFASVVGVFFSVILALSVVPAVLTILPKMRVPVRDANSGEKKAGMLDDFLSLLAEFNLRHRILILVVCLGVATAAILGTFRMVVDTDFLSFFREDDPITIANQVQQEYLAGAAPFFVVLDGRESNRFKDPSMLRKMDLLQTWMTEEVDDLDYTLSIVDYIKLLGKVFHNNDPKYYRIPDTQQEVAQYLLFYSFSGDPEDFSPYVNGDYSMANIMVRSRIVGSTETEKAIQKIERYARELFGEDAEVRVTGTIRMINKSASEVVVGQVKGILACLAAIFIVMSILFKSPKVGFLTMLPNILPIVILFGVMGFGRVTLNFSTSIIACIAIGLGVDDTIHLMSRYTDSLKELVDINDALRQTIRVVGKPVIYTSMSLFFGFMIIAGSDFVPLRQFGILTSMTIIVCLIADLALLPALTSTVRVSMLWDYVDLGIGRQSRAEINIFKGLSTKQTNAASLMCVFGFHSRNEVIVKKGDMNKDLFVVLDGKVKAVDIQDGKEVVLERLSEGMHFGWRPGTEPSPSPVSWVAEVTTKLLVINPLTIDRLRSNFPKIAEQVQTNIQEMGCPLSEPPAGSKGRS